MANLDLLVIETERKKRKPSSEQDITFNSITVGVSAGVQLTKDINGNLSLNNVKLSSVASPTNASDAATKGYVDSVAQGLDPKASVRTASSGHLSLSGSTPLTVGGVSVDDGDRILLKDQNDAEENGLYLVSISGGTYSLNRTEDADEDFKVTAGLYTFVEEGDYENTGWILITNDPITVGTTGLTFTQFTGAGSILAGNGVDITGNTISVIASDLAGDGLQEVSNKLEVKAGSGITVDASGVSINASDLAGDGLESVLNELRVKASDTSISVTASGIAVDYTEDFMNVEGTTLNPNQIVWESGSGNVELARADDPLTMGSVIGVVYESIPNTAVGRVVVKPGAIISGFVSLNVNSPVYLSRNTAGGLTQSLAGFLPGEHVIVVGKAITTTQILFAPVYKIEF
jgi:hypothetical protein